MASLKVDFWNNRVNGGSNDDVISGDWRWNTLDGNGGDDTIYGYGGNDTMLGGSGDDYLNGGDDNDILNGGDNNDELLGGDGNDELFGGDGNDELSGNVGDDRLDGGGGNDIVHANVGVDKVFGGAGNDEIFAHGDDGFRYDLIYGDGGHDTLDISGDRIIAHGGDGNDTFRTDLGGGAGGVYLIGDYGPYNHGNDRFVLTEAVFNNAGVAHIYGGDADYVLGNQIVAHTLGDVTAGEDTGTDTLDMSELDGPGRLVVDLIEGTLVHDVTGNTDFIRATLHGIENVVGSETGDTILGNAADNTLEGRAGNDFIAGGQGADTLIGGSGHDVMEGGTSGDSLQGEAGNDQLYGDGSSDVLEGGAGDDELYGGADWDVLSGGAGRDELEGGGGDDWLYGDLEPGAVYADTLTGGEGADRFVFTDVGKSYSFMLVDGRMVTRASAIVDTIEDFDAFGADHDFIKISDVLQAEANFFGSYQQAMSEGYIYFAQGPVGARLMFDRNGGTHTDTENVFAVADLEGVALQDVANRADLFIS
jgi:Ca2+-binding RTX toxin-like protein